MFTVFAIRGLIYGNNLSCTGVPVGGRPAAVRGQLMLTAQSTSRLMGTIIAGLLTLIPITVLGSPQTAQNVFEINQMLKPGLGCADGIDNDSDGSDRWG